KKSQSPYVRFSLYSLIENAMAQALSKTLAENLLPLATSAGSVRFYKKRQILYNEGLPAAGIRILHSGEAKVYKTGPEGRAHILYIASPHDVIGLESLFHDSYSPSGAEMIEEGYVCFLEKQAVLDAARRDPEIALQIMRELSARLISSDEERV